MFILATFSNSIIIVVIYVIEMYVRVNSLLQYLYILIPLGLSDVLVPADVIIYPSIKFNDLTWISALFTRVIFLCSHINLGTFTSLSSVQISTFVKLKLKLKQNTQ